MPPDIAGMRTLVTGATGFLGRHLVPLLREAGDPVRALVRPGTDARGLERLGVEVVRGGLLDEDAPRAAAAGCGLVFHLAGLVSHERTDRHRLAVVNVAGVRACQGSHEQVLAREIRPSSSIAAGSSG